MFVTNNKGFGVCNVREIVFDSEGFATLKTGDEDHVIAGLLDTIVMEDDGLGNWFNEFFEDHKMPLVHWIKENFSDDEEYMEYDEYENELFQLIRDVLVTQYNFSYEYVYCNKKLLIEHFEKAFNEEYAKPKDADEPERAYTVTMSQFNEALKTDYLDVVKTALDADSPHINKLLEVIMSNEENEQCCCDREPTENLSFGRAFELVKRGKGMRLPQWQPDVVIRAQYPDANSKMTAPYLYVESRFGRVPWKETMIELFAENWQVVD